MKTVIVDARNLTTKKEAHAYLKEIFEFEDYYGANLDALYDCLTDEDDLKILITNVDAAGPYFLEVYPVFMEAADTMIIECEA